MISQAELRAGEGRQVNLSLTDGTHLDGCCLVSAGRLWARTVWLVNGETDLFVRLDEIAELCVLELKEAA